MSTGQIIFDMDGVITSEDGYWRAASCALLDLAARLGHAPSQEVDPWKLDPHLPTIARAKSLLINTNWDLCHLAAIALARRLCRHDPLNAQRLLALDWHSDEPAAALSWPADFAPELNALVAEILLEAGAHTGFEMMETLALSTTAAAPLFVRKGPVWKWLFRHFQLWFNGRATPARPGIMQDERLLLDPVLIGEALQSLTAAGWRLGIATGRTRAELIPTLARFDLLRYFDPHAIVTHDEVAAGEQELGGDAHLSKPHPFPFLRALFPQLPARELVSAPPPLPGRTVIVGDTLADIAAAAKIHAVAVGVLTGPGGAGATVSLAAVGATHLIPDVTYLPALLS